MLEIFVMFYATRNLIDSVDPHRYTDSDSRAEYCPEINTKKLLIKYEFQFDQIMTQNRSFT